MNVIEIQGRLRLVSLFFVGNGLILPLAGMRGLDIEPVDSMEDPD
jgi:hypothetical protein